MRYLSFYFSAAVGLIDSETEENFEFIFTEFKKACGGREDLTWIIDKDFREVRTIGRVFPHSLIWLCLFHVMTYMKKITTSAPVSKPEREFIFERFRGLVYSLNEEQFELNLRAFKNSIEGVTVLPPNNKNEVLLSDYFTRNWMSCKDMWALYLRTASVTLGDRTNNRIERVFRSIKHSAKKEFWSVPTPEGLLLHIVNLFDGKMKELRRRIGKKSLRIFSENQEINDWNVFASTFLNERGCILWNKVQEEKVKTDGRSSLLVKDGEGVEEVFKNKDKKLYTTDVSSCNCSFFSNHGFVCKHIVFMREKAKLPFIDPNLVDDRYLKSSEALANLTNQGGEGHSNGSEEAENEPLDLSTGAQLDLRTTVQLGLPGDVFGGPSSLFSNLTPGIILRLRHSNVNFCFIYL